MSEHTVQKPTNEKPASAVREWTLRDAEQDIACCGPQIYPANSCIVVPKSDYDSLMTLCREMVDQFESNKVKLLKRDCDCGYEDLPGLDKLLTHARERGIL